jgi:hypothetical protein
LPTGECLNWLIDDHEDEQDAWAYDHTSFLDEAGLRMYREAFPWSIVCLDE